MSRLQGRRALVTGATGFIGGRLVARLAAEGVGVRAFVSGYSRCARIARFPVELERGDLLDRSTVEAAAEGCDLIFHCAYGSRGKPEERRRVNIEGTDNVLAAARASGARLVHLSTQAVYGVPEEGEIDEGCERAPSGSTYGDSKLEAEERVLGAAAAGLEAVVLQPTAVYGPNAPVWTVGVLQMMQVGRVPLVEGGSGTCNAVYIDDVVEAMVLAATSAAAAGESFLVSASAPVTWGEFYGKYEELLGVPATVPMSREEALAAGGDGKSRRSILGELPGLLREPVVRQRLADTREGKLLARLLRSRSKGRTKSETPELDKLRRLQRDEARPPVHALAARDVAFFASTARVRIDKARKLLGYTPRFDLEQGMARTAAWARWAGLVPRVGSERVEVAGPP